MHAPFPPLPSPSLSLSLSLDRGWAITHGTQAQVFKTLRAAGQQHSMICIPEAAAQVASLMGRVRQTLSGASSEDRHAISEWCVDTIHRHICLVNSMCKVIF